MMKKISSLFVFLILCISCFAQTGKAGKAIPAAEMVHTYIDYLQDKKIALVINQTSVIGNTLLLDSLLHLGIDIRYIFAPEHGFRGTADAGENLSDDIDAKTGIPVISLYGKDKKPSARYLSEVDLVLFDIQDVGVRFYTYISTLHYVMEACAEAKKELLILDRPNPNGFYVDGPVLEPKYRSFVGMHPVPIVHGLTIAEYALMINGEHWLKDSLRCPLRIYTCNDYTHRKTYTLPIHPSPNLRDMDAVYLYPSLCLFEGTVISMGRGTYNPFKIIGHPDLKEKYSFQFMPQAIEGLSKQPPYENKICYGIDLRSFPTQSLIDTPGLRLEWLIELYNNFQNKEVFFNSFFEKLSGTSLLREQVERAESIEAIKASWQEGLKEYKTKRAAYLLYED